MGDLLGSLIWGAKSGQYCVIGGGSLQADPMHVMFLKMKILIRGKINFFLNKNYGYKDLFTHFSIYIYIYILGI
jgi:hypothetical protein